MSLPPTPRRLTNVAAALRFSALLRRRFTALVAEEPWARESGATPPVYGVLSVLAVDEAASQKELGDIVGLHASDMVTLMERLETLGWVTRDRDPEDRRRYRLRITAEGRARLRRFDELSRQAANEVLSPLTEAETATLHQLIAKVLDAPASRPASRAADRPA